MADNEVTAGVDLSSIEAQIGNLSKEELIKQLLDVKVRQRVATKKYYNPETAKKARLKRAQLVKAMEAKAKELGIYDNILAEANQVADEQLGVAAGEAGEGPEE